MGIAYKPELIRTVDEVPDDDVPFAQLHVSTYLKPLKGVIICPRPCLVYTHYYRGRTIPCLNNKSLCEGCQALSVRRFNGFLGCWDCNGDKLMIFHLTKEACKEHKRRFDDAKCDLRGYACKVVRLWRKSNARARLHIDDNRLPLENLPPPFPLLKCLVRIWSGDAPAPKPGDSLLEPLTDIPI